jgi:hypothetical protein
MYLMKPQSPWKVFGVRRWRFGAMPLVVVMAGCSRSPVIELRNQSTQTVSNLVVSGTGFMERIDSMAAGEGRRIAVRPKSESGLRVEFEVGGRKVDSGPQGYFEPRGGYRLDAVIGTNLEVRISDSRTGY